MSSEYLGWTERKPAPEYDNTRFDRRYSTRRSRLRVAIFAPAKSYNPEMPATFARSQQLPAGASHLSGDPKGLSLCTAQDGRNIWGRMRWTIRMITTCSTTRTSSRRSTRSWAHRSSTTRHYSQYPVYTPKSSSEYFQTRERLPNPMLVDGNYRGSFRSYKPREEEENWRKNDRQMLVDYQKFDSSPLSPHMYLDSPFNRSQDSRIVGSNFVQYTTRPKDSFLDKIDRTLAEVRSQPRYC
ncbi:hypothetical protein M3Y99_00614600 [Aphelenchoides fujianensis]|nr:hypothetical protein M3Y99_00614600 [Aphelenchoides fujianensis]